MSDARSYLVECYWPGVSEQKATEASRRVRAVSLELGRRGDELRFIGCVLIPGEEAMFCLFAGTEADVRAAAQEADIPLERVVECRWLDGNGDGAEAWRVDARLTSRAAQRRTRG
jgi:hypothetical protein